MKLEREAVKHFVVRLVWKDAALGRAGGIDQNVTPPELVERSAGRFVAPLKRAKIRCVKSNFAPPGLGKPVRSNPQPVAIGCRQEDVASALGEIAGNGQPDPF